jgi:ABC-type Fe3+-hydroxamate transport system substrate-binding protein
VQLHRSPSIAVRLVSLVPSITELLADLGLEQDVVGLTRFCVLPPGWKSRKTIVGGTKNVRIERVSELAPDLVIANREENVREQVEAIATFSDVHVTDVATVEDALAMIRDVGQLVERREAATALADEIRVAFDSLSDLEPAPAAYLIWRMPYMVAGGDTFISDVMRRGGLRNVFADQTRYPEVTPRMMSDAGAEVLLLSSEPFPFKDMHAAELARELAHATIELVDGQLFSWYGSRMRYMPAYLRRLHARLAEQPRAR